MTLCHMTLCHKISWHMVSWHMTFWFMIWEGWDNLTFYFVQLCITKIFGLDWAVTHSDFLIDPNNIQTPKNLWVQKISTACCLVRFAAFFSNILVQGGLFFKQIFLLKLWIRDHRFEYNKRYKRGKNFKNPKLLALVFILLLFINTEIFTTKKVSACY